MEDGGRKGLAHIVAVSMGYGHERAAHALRSLAKGSVIIANDYPGIPDRDKKLWETGKRWYERISRFKRVPLVGNLIFSAMDEIQSIPAFYPRRDLSHPSLQVRQTYAMIRHLGWCRHLIDTLAKDPLPLVSTFMTPAHAAEEYGYPGDIYVALCDADVSRAWVAMTPHKSRIRYLAPTGRVVERLKLYGVPESNIVFTGFPLPVEAVGGIEATQARKDLARRMCILDPKGVFAEFGRDMMVATLGQAFCTMSEKQNKKTPITLTFAVGGAGAQREVGAVGIASLAARIRRGDIVVNLVAGTRPDVAQFFRHAVFSAGLGAELKRGRVSILLGASRADYFERFERLMLTTDVLWTKPSELSFFTGLGIPIVMTEPVGSQEVYNQNWLLQTGGGANGLDPRYIDEWLFDWVNGGGLARMAWNGYVNAPTHGAYRIEHMLSGKPWSMHTLPLVV